tara:strand:+ start:86 stop:703 length:618 start_codon:yes stop_codon:yes gene_type:complete
MILTLFGLVNAYNLCVVGSKSGLGRELIYQGLEENKSVLGLSKNNMKVMVPYRGGGLDWKNTFEYIENRNLQTDIYDNNYKYNYENIVFTTSGKPFEDDYSAELTEMILFNNNKKQDLKNIVLISAFGAGETLEDANVGIKLMNNWYLNSVYASKNAQEKLLHKYKEKNDDVNLIILRPEVLSYGKSIYASKSREVLAKEIIEML